MDRFLGVFGAVVVMKKSSPLNPQLAYHKYGSQQGMMNKPRQDLNWKPCRQPEKTLSESQETLKTSVKQLPQTTVTSTTHIPVKHIFGAAPDMKKIYIWDIDFLTCKLNDPNLVVIVPDFFYQRMYDDLPWTLMSPQKHPLLWYVSKTEFQQIYVQIESHYWSSTVHRSARDLFNFIAMSQAETGYPFIKGMDSGETLVMAKL